MNSKEVAAVTPCEYIRLDFQAFVGGLYVI